MPRITVYAAAAVCLFASTLRAAEAFELKNGDRVVFVGDGLIEREQQYGFLELAMTPRFPDCNVTFRNIGWNGDTPAGASRAGLSLVQAGTEAPDEGWKQLVNQLKQLKPTVLIVGYGTASSFNGEDGVGRFRDELVRLLAHADEIAKPEPLRCVFLSPLPIPTAGPYAKVIAEVAAMRHAPVVAMPGKLDGVQLTAAGYREASKALEGALGWPTTDRADAATERLRREIVKKNELFFHRSRPANMAYIFGFRRREQGQNAVEIPKFDPLIAAAEERIAKLRALKPVDLPDEAVRTKSAVAKLTPQPRPDFTVADGLEITLWAENPLLFKPTQINFDPKGRLWVASSEVYPQVEPGQTANDKIIVLEDTTGSGHADKSTVFADGLLIPTGLEPGDGGVYVAQSTELLHFRERDGKVERRTILSGFGTEDTHHNLHTLRWGPDGRLYMNQSIYTRSDVETPHGVTRLRSGGTMAYDTKTQRLDVVFRGWVNSWGHAFDRNGQSFLTDGAGGDGISWGVPGAMYTTYAGARRLLGSISPGNYPKFCGLEMVDSQHFPADWQGDLVTCDFRANRIVRFKLSDDGAGFAAKQVGEIVRGNQASFRPIDVKLGPDGALYVADWSNPIINHGEVDFRDPRRDREHGRIWRIAAKDRSPTPRRDWSKADTSELRAALKSANGYDRAKASRVLIERGETAHLYNAHDVQHPESKVSDPNPRVRLEAVRALGRRTNNAVTSLDAALRALDQPMDRFLDYALWLTANELATPWLAKLDGGEIDVKARGKAAEFVLSAVEPARATKALGALLAKNPIPADGSGPWIDLVAAAGGPGELRKLLDQSLANGFDTTTTPRVLRALLHASRARRTNPAGDLTAIARYLDVADEPTRVAALQLVGRWAIRNAAAKVRGLAADRSAAVPLRLAALDAMRDMRAPNLGDAMATIANDAGEPPTIRRQAALGWLAADATKAVPTVVTLLGDDREFWRSVVTQSGVAPRLAAELREKRLSADAAKVGLTVVRSAGGRTAELEKVLLVLSGQAAAREWTPGDVQRLGTIALLQGDAARGEAVYRRADLRCVACHAINGAGGKVGPDLMSIGTAAPPDYIAESLLMPNAKVKEGFHTVNVLTKAAKALSGIAIKDTPTELVLRDAEGKDTTIPKDQIDERSVGQSLMPNGLLDQLFDYELHDLTRFLIELGKAGPFDATKSKSPKVWRAGDELVTTTVGGELLKKELKVANPRVELTTRFDATADGSVAFNFGGVVPEQILIDGKAVDAAKVTLTRGTHTLTAQCRFNDLPPRWKVIADGVVGARIDASGSRRFWKRERFCEASRTEVTQASQASPQRPFRSAVAAHRSPRCTFAPPRC
ncbi:MAG: PVC-type heme-binding CxxCH protein [Gemmataceae bacterium]